MIDKDVLDKNPDWIEDRRVVKSGKAWGDDEDPVEWSAEALIQCLGADQPEVIAALEAGRATQQAEERASELHGEETLIELAAVLLS